MYELFTYLRLEKATFKGKEVNISYMEHLGSISLWVVAVEEWGKDL